MERIIEYRQLVYIISLFLLVQFLGLLIVFFFLPPVAVAPTQQASSFDALWFFLYVLAGTVFLLLIFKFYHGAAIYAIIEGVIVVIASFYLFLIILGSIFPQRAYVPEVVAASIALPILLMIAKYRKPWLRNEVAIIASLGAGIVLGFLPFTVAFAFMMIIAAYDYVAVFVTKHMLALGKQAVDRNMALLVGSSEVELVPKAYLSKRSIKELKKLLAKAKIRNKQIKQAIRQGALPVPTQTALGTGDLTMPLMLAVSAYFSFASYFFAVVIAVGASLGLVFTMYLLKTYKIGLPAIPPLFSFIAIALGLSLVAKNTYFGSLLVLLGFLIAILMIITARRVAKKQGRSIF